MMWAHHLFVPKIASRGDRSTPTVYMAMTVWRGKPYKNIQEFERACRVPRSPDKNGQPRPGFAHAYPEPIHFVYLLPPHNADELQVRALYQSSFPLLRLFAERTTVCNLGFKLPYCFTVVFVVALLPAPRASGNGKEGVGGGETTPSAGA